MYLVVLLRIEIIIWSFLIFCLGGLKINCLLCVYKVFPIILVP